MMVTGFRLFALASALLLALPLPSSATEGEWRWRIFDLGNALGLFVLDSDDAATDALGSHRFTCQKGSGTIQVENLMRPEEREVFADLIRRDAYPAVQVVLADGKVVTTVAEPHHSDLDGWTYSYELSANSQTFDDFVRSGTLRVIIGEKPIEATWTGGLDAIAKFQAACVKP